jgi:hypothetical protein
MKKDERSTKNYFCENETSKVLIHVRLIILFSETENTTIENIPSKTHVLRYW